MMNEAGQEKTIQGDLDAACAISGQIKSALYKILGSPDEKACEQFRNGGGELGKAEEMLDGLLRNLREIDNLAHQVVTRLG